LRRYTPALALCARHGGEMIDCRVCGAARRRSVSHCAQGFGMQREVFSDENARGRIDGLLTRQL
jgi:hypothetical protein